MVERKVGSAEKVDYRGASAAKKEGSGTLGNVV